MSDNPWQGFEHPEYELIDIGRPAVFLVPNSCLTREQREELELFLKETYGGFQRLNAVVSGVYTSENGDTVLDDCIQYEVSFKGKDRIPELARMLANLARLTGEEAIYLKAGQYSALLRPRVR